MFCRNTHKIHKPLGKLHPQADPQHWETYISHRTGNLIWQKEEGGETSYTSYKAHLMRQYIVYTKGRGKKVHKPSRMYRISLQSESPKSWVFTKPGNSNIQKDAVKSKKLLFTQDDRGENKREIQEETTYQHVCKPANN